MIPRNGSGPDLLAALRARDPAAARPLWQTMAHVVFRLLRRALGPDAPVDDLAQAVLLRIFDAGPRIRDEARLRAFVLSAVARVARDHLRASGAAPASNGSGPEPLPNLYRNLNRLRPRDQVAFALHFIEGLDIPDVAAAVGASPAATKRRLARAWARAQSATELKR